MTPTFSDHYSTLLGELDKTLSMVRGFWIEARDDNERTKSMKRLNELLDERLRLMKARDAAVEMSQPVHEGVAQAGMVKSVKVKGDKS